MRPEKQQGFFAQFETLSTVAEFNLLSEFDYNECNWTKPKFFESEKDLDQALEKARDTNLKLSAIKAGIRGAEVHVKNDRNGNLVYAVWDFVKFEKELIYADDLSVVYAPVTPELLAEDILKSLAYAFKIDEGGEAGYKQKLLQIQPAIIVNLAIHPDKNILAKAQRELPEALFYKSIY